MPYPPGMDFGAYDDYTDPVLDCGHRSSAECECYSACDKCGELYLTEDEEWVEVGDEYYCEGCGEEIEGEDDES
jgi:predicted RNA-binding Zn-ribbon protein involved in translation (DUF1610 family)